jgi:hypothetical protein
MMTVLTCLAINVMIILQFLKVDFLPPDLQKQNASSHFIKIVIALICANYLFLF